MSSSPSATTRPAIQIEHVNVTVSNSRQTADLLSRLFEWHIRWQGPSLDGGHTVHVGTDDSYVALYTPAKQPDPAADSDRLSGLQHIGVVVDDLELIENRVIAAGLGTQSHQTYDPGSRFYFNDPDGVEYEVVSYTWDGSY